jgi:hypothetical protein
VPYTDEDSVLVVEEAATSLALVRAPMWSGDAGPMISVLVSLSDQAQDLLFDVVALARDQGYTWDDIARRLAATPVSARRRYAGQARSRQALLFDGD